jgi:hypothetical protein
MTRTNEEFGNGTGTGRAITMYHGTSEENAKNIMANGFNDNTHLHPDASIAGDYGTHIIKVTIPDNLKFESPLYHEQDHEAKMYGEKVDGTYDVNYYHSKDDPGSERIIYDGKKIIPVSMTKNMDESSAGYRE